MKVSLPLLLTASFAHARPVAEHSLSPLNIWGSTIHDVWDVICGSALGWFNLGVYDELEGTYPLADKTIYKWLSDNPKFSNITKLIDYEGDVKKLLNDEHNHLTFLAPNNDALTPPQRRKTLPEIKPHDPDALLQLVFQSSELHAFNDHKDDDGDKERKKKIFRALLKDVLNYHILPRAVTSTKLGENSTVQTNLNSDDASYNRLNRRIKIEKKLVPPTVTINKYATIVHGDFEATNGLIHELDELLIPPPSILQSAYLFPQYLSTFTSALQKVRLEDDLDWYYKKSDSKDKKGRFVGAPVVTSFIPNNEAWEKLPRNLIIYLFSPFGEKALTKILKYHVVPDYIVHAEWIYSYHPENNGLHTKDTELEYKFPFPTALKGYKLPVHIVKSTPALPVPGIAYFEFTVLDTKIERTAIDFVARNGAFHVVNTVLNPLQSTEHDDDKEKTWDNWEEWLPKWARDD